ncbi:hypothetical protein AUC68_03830 [Methyloceanibacter methanicus]|uniref:Cupin type-2 domain-containing protein n=1 Tax=Methyloceanibacter methanicus TaxID=1774968 RepID=A0A1E3W036_9HYPH|nr:cupin domain-containing protein [Methyloceanibacter methanicus]ODR99164.1 hypothetical protein AUC68_03830 [Methyloceanibacter methanicus]
MTKTEARLRRVAIGETAEGRPCVARDDAVAPIETPLMPEAKFFSLWGADAMPSVPNDGAAPDFHAWFPPAGGFRFELIELPPQGVGQDAKAPTPEEMKQALKETEALLPGLIRTMDPRRPGMHRTDTIDMIYVTEGASLLVLDTGEEIAMGTGDSVVLNGQPHAWRNPHEAPCRLLTISLGVKRAG